MLPIAAFSLRQKIQPAGQLFFAFTNESSRAQVPVLPGRLWLELQGILWLFL
jgi:hypothetical protein